MKLTMIVEWRVGTRERYDWVMACCPRSLMTPTITV